MKLVASSFGVIAAVFWLSLGAMGSGFFQEQAATLDGSNPHAYLLFAESQYTDPQSSPTIAIQSALHGAWIANQQGNRSLAASCVIAAAAFATDREARDLWDLAVTLDPTRESQWLASQAGGDSVQIQAADVVLDARYGIGDVGPPGVGSVEIQRAINTAGSKSKDSGIADSSRLVSILIEAAADDSCRGRVFVPKKNSETKKMERVLCPDHLRPLGAGRSDTEFIELLRVEMHLRGVRSHAWGQGGGVPLLDPTIIDMMHLYQISPDRPYWREERWLPSS